MIDNYEMKIVAIARMAEIYNNDKKETENKRDYSKFALEFVRAFKFIYALFALDVVIDFGSCRFQKTKNGVEMTYSSRRCRMSDINKPIFTFSDWSYDKELPRDMPDVYKRIPEDVLGFLLTREYENYAEEIVSAQQKIVRTLQFMNELEHKFNMADAENQLKIIHQLDQLKKNVEKQKTIHINTNIKNVHPDLDDEPCYEDEDVRDMDRFPDFH